MATTTLSKNPQLITAPDGNENEIDFDHELGKLGAASGYAKIYNTTTPVQVSVNGQAISAASPSSCYFKLPIKKGRKLKYKTGSGDLLNILIVR